MVRAAGDSGFIAWADAVDADGVADAAALAAHLADTVDAHDATAVSFSPAQGIAATTVQAAIEEVVTDTAATYVPITGKLSGIAEPVIIAHRGGANVVPENTMEALRNAVACGLEAIEVDCVLLSDGSVAVMHDATVDRTTTASGNAVDWSAAGWHNLVVDAGTVFGGGWGNLKAPLFDDVVREFGNRVLLVPEIKTGGASCAAAIVAVLQKYGVHGQNALVQSFTYTDLASVTAAGYQALALGDALTPATIAAAGIGWVGCSSSATSGYITSLKNAGLGVVVYTVNRHDDRDTFLGYGVDGFFSDDPLYLTGSGYRRTTDPFVTQTFYPGHVASSAADRGQFSASDKWGFTTTVAAYRGALQGWACPVGDLADNDSWTLSLSCQFVSASPDNGRWVGVFFADDDKQFNDSAGSGVNGYQCLARKDGTLNIYRITDGVATQVATTTGTTISDGATATYLLTVTPSDITWARTDVATSCNTTDTTYRGGYFHLGRNGAACYFSDITVTDT